MLGTPKYAIYMWNAAEPRALGTTASNIVFITDRYFHIAYTVDNPPIAHLRKGEGGVIMLVQGHQAILHASLQALS